MNHSSITLNFISPIARHGPSSSDLVSRQNPKLALSVFPPLCRAHSVFNRTNGVEISAPKHCPKSSSNSLNGSAQDWMSRSALLKNVDVASLGNLCVDIVLKVPNLPPAKLEDRKAYMDHLAASPPDKVRLLSSYLCL